MAYLFDRKNRLPNGHYLFNGGWFTIEVTSEVTKGPKPELVLHWYPETAIITNRRNRGYLVHFLKGLVDSSILWLRGKVGPDWPDTRIPVPPGRVVRDNPDDSDSAGA